MAKTKGAKIKDGKELPGAANATHKKAAFLRAYRKTGGKTTAAKSIGVERSTVWRWEKEDAAFREAVLDVEETDTEELELSARQRAVNDTREGAVLTMFLLKGRKPEKYRENVSLEASGKGGGPITVELVDYSKAVKGKEGTK